MNLTCPTGLEFKQVMRSLNAGDSGGKEEIDALSYRDEFSIDEEGRKVIWIIAHSSLHQMIIETKGNHSLKGQAFVSVYPERLVLVLPESDSAKHGGRRHLLKSDSLMVDRIHSSSKSLMEEPAEDRTVVENNKWIKWEDCCEHMTILNEPDTQYLRTTGAFEISTARVCCTDQSARLQVAGIHLRVEFKQPNIVEWIPLISEPTDLVSPRKEMGWRKMEEANGYERDYRRLMDCPNNNNWRTISIIINLLENRFDDNDKLLGSMGCIIGKNTRQRIPGAAIRAARPIEKGTFDWMKISTVKLLEGYNADAFWKKDYTRSICTRSIWDWELEPKNEVLGAKKDCGLDIGGHKGIYSSLVIRDDLGKNNGEDTMRTMFMGERVLVEPKGKEPHDHYNLDKVYRVNDGRWQCKLDGPSEVLGASTRCRVKARLTGHKDEKGSRELYAYREEPREAGFYVRPVGFAADVEDGGRAACRIARAKIDQTFDEGSGVQNEQWEVDDMPDVLTSDDDSEDEGEERRTTRAQVALRTKEEKRKPADVIDSDSTTVQLAEGLMNSRIKKQRMYQVDTMDAEERKKEDDGYVQAIELQLLHDQKLSAWAWGTGMAEQYQGDAREEDWENQASGLQVRDIWGLESQAESMRNYRMMIKVEVVEVRLEWLRHINARSRAAHKEHKTETICYLEEVQERGGAGGAAGGSAGGEICGDRVR
jgi:hypothetical protein